jgi:hypothetical protein
MEHTRLYTALLRYLPGYKPSIWPTEEQNKYSLPMFCLGLIGLTPQQNIFDEEETFDGDKHL